MTSAPDAADGSGSTEPMPAWSGVIDAVGPASLLVVIQARMGETLRHRLAPEDVLQEVFLQAWRDREAVEWRGVQAFRSWLLTLVDHRLADATDYFNARKRGGPGIGAAGVGADPRGASDPLPEPVITTTPSRLASYKEQAELMQRALLEVPEECREVVRLRLFEELPMAEVAACVGIGVSAAGHRFRKGAAIYQRVLAELLSTRTRGGAGSAG